jgi:protocatechuate 3,4-dioxygenase alpha subunit
VSGLVTPSQTVGPFFGFGLPWEAGPHVVPDGTPGAFRIEGRVTDGAGAPVDDALVETWQADPAGRFAHPDDPRGPGDAGFRGFGRCGTDADGRFFVVTVKPGRVPCAAGLQAPHIDVSVFARGLLQRVVTRIYFSDEAEANAGDPVLLGLPEGADPGTLVARAQPGGYRFDVHLQGEDETVFFAV